MPVLGVGMSKFDQSIALSVRVWLATLLPAHSAVLVNQEVSFYDAMKSGLILCEYVSPAGTLIILSLLWYHLIYSAHHLVNALIFPDIVYPVQHEDHLSVHII